VAHVEAEENCSFELGSAFSADLVEVRMVERVEDIAGEATVATLERRGMGDRTEAEELVLRRDGEQHADVSAAIASGRLARPWGGDQE